MSTWRTKHDMNDECLTNTKSPKQPLYDKKDKKKRRDNQHEPNKCFQKEGNLPCNFYINVTNTV